MDLRQQCLDCSKTYSYIGAYITHLHRDHEERIVYVSAEQLPDDGVAIEYDSIVFPFIHEPHRNPIPHPSNYNSSDTEAYSTMCVSIQSNLLIGHVFVVLHTWTTI